MIGIGLNDDSDIVAGPQPGPVIDDWVAGSNTILTVDALSATAESVGGNNPRISCHITELEAGATYRITSSCTTTANPYLAYYRVSATAELSLADYGSKQINSTAEFTVDFVAPASGDVYAGVVGVANVAGDTYTLPRTIDLQKVV